ncbi:PREDICTED: low affinity immunoglobulin gamma Fc region receptor II-a [Nipponia nippon]|uniref:low affinity immunoglobulin gamma Fc region receptor II-a n=1 Tax=Nipponia nippon TaxID=128390 RepID=UPI0005111F0F|nr:PREDICTED: low affinity immunoglobulin gamma Fc region receptor II-a [Nipponia nippon]
MSGGPTSTQQRARMARSAALLLWAQALGLTGAQPSQVTLDPPWMPVFLNEKVTLTCWGSGVPGPTDWYINEQYWWRSESDHIHVSKDRPGSSSYQCRIPGAELSPAVTVSFSNDWLVLQVPAQALLEGDMVSLRCRAWKNTKITKVQFFHEQEVLGGPSQGAELLLPPLQLHHSGRYHCQATLLYYLSWEGSTLVTVQELFSVPVLRLEGPAEPPEGAPLALSCLSHLSPLRPLTRLQYLFYRDEAVVGGPQGSPQLQLLAVGLQHSGNYSCEVQTETASVRKHSAPVTVTVRRVPVSGVSLVAQPPRGQVVEGDRLVLSCLVAVGTGPLSFSWHRQGLATPLATGPRYELRAVQHQDGGRYHCTATNGGTAANSPPLWVTVLVPVVGATITMARMEPSVLVGESLNLSCSVRAGTAPVTFTWLRDGQELGSGPVLSLEAVEPAHTGTYQCLATNRLGTHRIFRVLSPALALSVMQPGRRWQRRDTDVAVGLSVSLLLLLLLGAAMAWHLRRRHRAAAGNSRGRLTYGVDGFFLQPPYSLGKQG